MMNKHHRNCYWLRDVTLVLSVAGLLGLVEASSTEEESSKSQCGLYLAPSSIPGAGLGIFVGDQPVPKGKPVAVGDILIPIVELKWHNQNRNLGNFLWDEYTWTASDFDNVGMDEQEVDDSSMIEVVSPGLGAAANCYLSLRNVRDDWDYTKIGRAVKGDSPGVGAISPYYGRSFATNKYLPRGAEIFLDYGENYFKTRTKKYGYLPLPRDYRVADKLLRKFLILKTKLARRSISKSSSSSFGGSSDGDDLLHGLWDTVGFIKSHSNSRVLNALPANVTHVDNILQIGGTARQDLGRSIRDISWLEDNGQCMDNIKVNRSDIPDAGRGAFANRWIPVGGLIAPAPLIHIADSKVLQMFQPKAGKTRGKVNPNQEGPTSSQLLKNYCFGHEESTLLLCPYGVATAYINHSSKQPNAKIIWSETNLQEPDWLGLKVEAWTRESYSGLAFDVVALRDIKEDEEILINYGEAWEHAWEEHVRDYIPRENYMPAYELNELEHIEYRTNKDRDYRADGVELWCRSWYVRRQLKDHVGGDTECEILKHLGDDRYMARLAYGRNNDENRTMTHYYKAILWNVPSDAFYFADIAYSRDHNLFNAFRYPMMIPDDIFPNFWKNKRKASFLKSLIFFLDRYYTVLFN